MAAYIKKINQNGNLVNGNQYFYVFLIYRNNTLNQLTKYQNHPQTRIPTAFHALWWAPAKKPKTIVRPPNIRSILAIVFSIGLIYGVVDGYIWLVSYDWCIAGSSVATLFGDILVGDILFGSWLNGCWLYIWLFIYVVIYMCIVIWYSYDKGMYPSFTIAAFFKFIPLYISIDYI